LAKISPLTVPIVAPVMFDVAATDPKVWTAQEAYAHFGIPTPREQYAAILATRAAG